MSRSGDVEEAIFLEIGERKKGTGGLGGAKTAGLWVRDS
jgi:hypothetical protein